MAEENTNTMNLDLNLGPVDDSNDGGEPPYPNVAMNFEDWLDSPVHRVREVVRQRNHRWRSLWRQLPIPPETRNLALELIPQTGEGSVASDGEVAKICENVVEEEELGKRKDGGKGNGDEGSFFDCNICLDLAKDPVVTCCGHLFCWPCLYRWLHHHSDAKECPVCKGEVTTKHVTPIYGRGNGNVVREADVDSDSNLKIPVRPHARRIESWRQTLERTATAFTIPMEEMIRRLGSAFDLNRELAQIQTRHDSPERLLNRLLSSRAMRTPPLPPPPILPTQPTNDVIDLTLTEMRDRDRDSRRLLLRRSSSSHHRAMNLVESSYFHSPPPVDDRDSVSSIAAVIHSESHTVDNADSTVALSTSSSRRRNEASRISDLDTGDSRAPRRRRLN